MQIDDGGLARVLKSFYTLTGVRIAVLDKQCQEIAAYPREISLFCKRQREDAAFNQRCICSDQAAMEIVRQTGKQYTYRCHAGLHESLYPIWVGSSIVGYLMIGQFMKKSERELLRSHLAFSNHDSKMTQEALDILPTL